jgi:hypothetical protein
MQEIGITKPQKPVQRVAVIALGWVLILLGIVGLVLPVLPGAALIVVGVLTVNPQATWLGRIREKCRVSFPVLAPAFRRFCASSKSNQSLFCKHRSDAGAQFEGEMAHCG